MSEDGRFSIVQRVRFADLDAMNHLNHAQALRFFESARIEWIAEVLPEATPGSKSGFGFILAEVHAAFKSQASFREEIRIWVWPGELRRSSMRLDFELRSEDDERLVSEGWCVLVGFDWADERPRPLPEFVRERIEPLLG